MRWLLFAPLVFFSSLSFALETPVSGSVAFDAVGKPSMLKIHGEGKQLRGTLKRDAKTLSGDFVVKLDDLDTGMKLRNEHMKTKYLETAKYPEARFKLDALSLPMSEGEFKGLPFSGLITIRGVEKSVSGTSDIVATKTIQNFSASFAIKISDFGMKIPSFAGVTVAEDVQVKVTMKP